MIEDKDCEERVLLGMLAAFMDGEGTVSIGRQMFKGKYNYSQRIRISNTDIRLIEWLVENFGGSFPKPQNKGENFKDNYNWALSGNDEGKNDEEEVEIMVPVKIRKDILDEWLE